MDIPTEAEELREDIRELQHKVENVQQSIMEIGKTFDKLYNDVQEVQQEIHWIKGGSSNEQK
jgi:uncharacterized coiled-coil DUF342 family protein